MVYFILAAVIAAVDLASKFIINKKVKEGREIEVIPKKIFLTNIKNSGAAGGLLKEYTGILNLLSFVSLGNFMRIVLSIIKREEKSSLYKLALSCITGGAIGNIAERIGKKKVTDFIFFKYKSKTISPRFEAKVKSSPVFNIADIFIVFGMILFVIRNMFRKHK